LGSSNLTLAGLSKQGELNIDVTDQDACAKLSRWFEDRWNDRWCLDISNELVSVIEKSWARADPIPPYLDRVLARHYGFTDEELDFIINYDIKYRMGQESSEDVEK
jgi:hypothetical protein